MKWLKGRRFYRNCLENVVHEHVRPIFLWWGDGTRVWLLFVLLLSCSKRLYCLTGSSSRSWAMQDFCCIVAEVVCVLLQRVKSVKVESAYWANKGLWA